MKNTPIQLNIHIVFYLTKWGVKKKKIHTRGMGIPSPRLSVPAL